MSLCCVFVCSNNKGADLDMAPVLLVCSDLCVMGSSAEIVS